ncbi:hypothetical protein EKD04_021810 [Chloroflexales bacterium ZM16-3]|nr:hypothetical protein [Chloroflexales bacterium ZM16-3]
MSEQQGGEILIPNEIKTVDFYGDPITGALVRVGEESRIYVPLRPVCDYLQLDWSSQRKRINRDEVLKEEIKGVVIMTTPGGPQEMICLPLDILPGWLFGITPGKITDPALREKITRYRRECYRRLWDAFAPSILPAITAAPVERQPSGAQLAYELATAVQNLARDQIDLEARMGKAAHWAKGIESRVTALELRLEGDEPISESQAADLALSVKNVAHLLTSKGTQNGYGRVYGELYRRNGITSYKTLPRSRFDEVMRWLQSWHDELSVE